MKRPIRLVGIGTAALILIIAITYVIVLIIGTTQIDREYAALEAANRPLDPSDIIPPKVPDQDNALLSYQAAILQLRSTPAGDTNALDRLAIIGEHLEEENALDSIHWLDQITNQEDEQSATRALVAEANTLLSQPDVQAALSTIRAGSTKPGYWKDLDWSKGPGLVLPNLSEEMRLADILKLTAILAEDAPTAWQCVIDAVALADKGRHQPILISQLVRLKQHRTALEALRLTAARFPIQTEHLLEIDALLAHSDETESFMLALDGERLLLGEWVFDQDQLATEVFGTDSALLRFIPKPLLLLDHAAYLRYMRAITEQAQRPITTSTRDPHEDIPGYCILTRMIGPALSGVRYQYAEVIALNRMTRIGLQSLHHKQESGNWPALSDLDAAITISPFSETPFDVSTTDNTITLTSPGKEEPLTLTFGRETTP